MNEIREERKKAIAMMILGVVIIVIAIALFGTAINGKLLASIILLFAELMIGLLCISYGHFYL